MADDRPLTVRDHEKYVSRIRAEAGRKGGKARVNKGIASLSPEARLQLSRDAHASKAAKRLNRILGG